jgi:UDP-N-acetylglucosamine 4,6-dehydratase/5-epimerase
MNEFYKNKIILVTGGCGSIGSEIVKKLLLFEPKQMRILDTSEKELFYLEQELKKYTNVRYLLGDICNKERIKFAIKDADIVFHAAALKHVPLCEYNPFEAVKTNILGTQNLVECAREEKISVFLSISTDKAVNPINTMGATKLLSEKIVLGGSIGTIKTKFSCVRFGNVLRSSGSVIPTFEKQILNNQPITITTKEMTRFFMSISQAVNLVLKSGTICEGDEIFILKMPSLKIIDLAEALMEKHNKKVDIEFIGKRPGEKNHEVLITEEEAEHVEELEDMYVLRKNIFVPHLTKISKKGNVVIKEYNSKNVQLLTKEEIKNILKD